MKNEILWRMEMGKDTRKAQRNECVFVYSSDFGFRTPSLVCGISLAFIHTLRSLASKMMGNRPHLHNQPIILFASGTFRTI